MGAGAVLRRRDLPPFFGFIWTTTPFAMADSGSGDQEPSALGRFSRWREAEVFRRA
jgi:hypothetical protein